MKLESNEDEPRGDDGTETQGRASNRDAWLLERLNCGVNPGVSVHLSCAFLCCITRVGYAGPGLRADAL